MGTAVSPRHLVLSLATFIVALAGLSGVAHADRIPLSVFARVEVAPGVPAPSCQATIYTYPSYVSLGSCDANGVINGGLGGIAFQVMDYWATVRVRIDVPGYPTRNVYGVVTELRDRQFAFYGVNPKVVDLGTVVVGPGATPGAVTGRLTLPTTDDYDAAIVGIPELGLFVQPNAGGVYLIPGVAPGARTVTLYLPTRSPMQKSATVGAGALVSGVSFLVLPSIGIDPVNSR